LIVGRLQDPSGPYPSGNKRQ